MPDLADTPLAELLESLAAKTPTPGGGAAACAAAAIGAATAGMVVSYSLGKKNLAQHQPVLVSADAYLRRARAMFLQLAEEDAAAYAELNALQKLPEGDPQRIEDLPAAAAACVGAPMASVAACADVLALLRTLAGITNTHLKSDLAVAAILTQSAADAGACNVRINLPLLAERARQAAEAQVTALVGNCRESAGAVRAACE